MDYENAINSAVRKLREALNDNSESPRFVETLPRRGYRFLAPVTRKTEAAPVQEAPPVAVREVRQPEVPPLKPRGWAIAAGLVGSPWQVRHSFG